MAFCVLKFNIGWNRNGYSFDGLRQKFASIGIHFAENGTPDAKIGSDLADITQKFAIVGKILPQPASVWRKSSKGMTKSASLWLPSAKICLNRHPFCGEPQTGCERGLRFSKHQLKICHHQQNIASVSISLAKIFNRHEEISIHLTGVCKNSPQSAFILREMAKRMGKSAAI